MPPVGPLRPADIRVEQNAVKPEIVDCAGCVHKREPLVNAT
jgi:hypothetical protein